MPPGTPRPTSRRTTRAVLTDFDGTVTQEDVAETILEEFAPPEWWDIEELHRARQIGTREAMARQFALVQAREADVLEFVDRTARMDPTFPAFVAHCKGRGVRLEIVSEGLDLYVHHLLRTWGLDLPVRTNHVTFADGRASITYPWADGTCTLCGTCKLLRLFELRSEGHRIAYVGDGQSDLCPAIEADVVFAKGELARLCTVEAIEFIPFERFSDVQESLDDWL